MLRERPALELEVGEEVEDQRLVALRGPVSSASPSAARSWPCGVLPRRPAGPCRRAAPSASAARSATWRPRSARSRRRARSSGNSTISIRSSVRRLARHVVELGGEEQPDPLAREARARVEALQLAPVPGGLADLLRQLPLRALERASRPRRRASRPAARAAPAPRRPPAAARPCRASRPSWGITQTAPGWTTTSRVERLPSSYWKVSIRTEAIGPRWTSLPPTFFRRSSLTLTRLRQRRSRQRVTGGQRGREEEPVLLDAPAHVAWSGGRSPRTRRPAPRAARPRDGRRRPRAARRATRRPRRPAATAGLAPAPEPGRRRATVRSTVSV